MFFISDRADPNEDPEVTRAKFFIRDEFLVCWNETKTTHGFLLLFSFVLFSESVQLPVTIAIHVIHILPVLLIQKIFVEYLMIVGISSNVCTWDSMNYCDYTLMSLIMIYRIHPISIFFLSFIHFFMNFKKEFLFFAFVLSFFIHIYFLLAK